MAEPRRKPVADAVAEAARSATERGTEDARARRGGRTMDVFGGEIRRRDLFPLLVLHLIEAEPQYGNRLIEEIERITEGVITVNPNTIYPLLRRLESEKLIRGDWEHPDRRTRRYYSITAAGKRERRRLQAELEPFLDSVIRSVGLIKRELYGA
ncbi:MAG TPA: PadR family transcriptional regulator [Solirubrobacterales bacterium]|nr:PadR family transcriptional regulator [Solirubrobacterales bacterium]